MVEARSVNIVKNTHTHKEGEKIVQKKGLVQWLPTQIIYRASNEEAGGEHKVLRAQVIVV